MPQQSEVSGKRKCLGKGIQIKNASNVDLYRAAAAVVDASCFSINVFLFVAHKISKVQCITSPPCPHLLSTAM